MHESARLEDHRNLKDCIESVEKAQITEVFYSCTVKNQPLASRKGGGIARFRVFRQIHM